MDDYTLDDLDADVREFFKDEAELARRPEEGEFTIDYVLEVMNCGDGGITKNRATRRMNEALDEGHATMRMWRNDEGHAVAVYKWVK